MQEFPKLLIISGNMPFLAEISQDFGKRQRRLEKPWKRGIILQRVSSAAVLREFRLTALKQAADAPVHTPDTAKPFFHETEIQLPIAAHHLRRDLCPAHRRSG